MFDRIGVEARIFYSLGTVVRMAGRAGSPPPRSWAERVFDQVGLARLAHYDVLILCGYMRPAFLKGYFGIEALRERFPDKPIVLHTVSYLGSSPDWQKRISEADGFGISRFDWHLVVAPVGKRLLPTAHPCQAVGINLEIPALFPEKKSGFTALLDHPREGFERERRLQVEALGDLKIPVVELGDPLSFAAIYKIYRATSIYFLAFLESFGIPICEAQLCGNLVFTPDPSWPQAHRQLEPFRRDGSVVLSENFLVYGDLRDLKSKISQARDGHDPIRIQENFIKRYPHYYKGDLAQLKRFVESAEAGELWGRDFRRED
jgi:hypothetical protein